MWNLSGLIEFANNTTTNVNGQWVPCRPINYKYRSLRERLWESWMVFVGKAESFVWDNKACENVHENSKLIPEKSSAIDSVNSVYPPERQWAIDIVLDTPGEALPGNFNWTPREIELVRNHLNEICKRLRTDPRDYVSTNRRRI